MQITTAATEAAMTGKSEKDIVAERAAARRAAELGNFDRDALSVLPGEPVFDDFAHGFAQVDLDLLNLGLDPAVDALVERLSVLATPLSERERRWALASGRPAEIVPIPTVPARQQQKEAA